MHSSLRFPLRGGPRSGSTRVGGRSVLAAIFLTLPAWPAFAGSFDDLLRTGEHVTFEVPDPELSTRSGERVAYAIRATVWRPTAASELPTIVYNHGLQSHRGWFYATAEELVAAGHPVIAFDRIGSGQSDPGATLQRGEIHRASGHIRDWRLFVATLDAAIRWMDQEFPERPVVVWGNSYGAKVVAAYLFHHRDDLEARRVARAVFTVPGLYSDSETMPLPFSKLGLLISGGAVPFLVPMVEENGDNGAHWFVDPGPWFNRIRDDEFSLRQATRTFFLQTVALDRYLAKRPRGERLPVPGLFLMVRGDRMMDNQKMTAFIDRRAAPDSVTKLFAGGAGRKHFLLFTEDRDQALADVLRFLAGHEAEIEGREKQP